MNLFHLIKYFFLLLTVFTLLIWSLLNTYSVFLQQIPRQAMDYWNCTGKIDDKINWEHQEYLIEQAYRLFPGDATINYDMARLYEWRAINSEAWSDTATQSRAKSISHYEAVTRLRPTSANGWVYLLKSKSLNQQFDKDAGQLFRNILFYGKNQTEVQAQIIWLGLGMWNSINNTTKDEIRMLISQLLEKRKKENYILVTAFRFNWIAELKDLTSHPQFKKRLMHLENNPGILRQALSPQIKNVECVI